MLSSCFPCFRPLDEGHGVKKPAPVAKPDTDIDTEPEVNVRGVCLPGPWFSEALEAQREVFTYSELNGVSISEGRLPIGVCGNHFVNYVVAKGRPGTEALDLRLAVRTGNKCPGKTRNNKPKTLRGEVLYRPGTTAVEGRPLGRVLVLLASWGTGIGTFARCLPALVDHFEAVYCLDLPGMGLSSRWYPDNDADTSRGNIASQFQGALAFALNQLAVCDTTYKLARTRVLAAHSISCAIAARAVENVNTGTADSHLIHVLTCLSPIEIEIPRMNISAAAALLNDLSRPERMLRKLAIYCVRKGITPQLVLRSMRSTKAYQLFQQQMRAHVTTRRMPEEMMRYLFVLNRLPRALAQRGGDKLVYDLLFSTEKEDGRAAKAGKKAKGAISDSSMYDLLFNTEEEDGEKQDDTVTKVTKGGVPVAFIYGEEDIVTYANVGNDRIDADGFIARVIDDSKHFPFVENVPVFASEFIETFREAMQWISQQPGVVGRNA